MNTTQAINGELKPGDWVISVPDVDYGCLVGQVKEIVPLGSQEHDTGNETDDVHVNFMTVEYPDIRKAQFFEAYDYLDPDADNFDELPLDDVIMAPEDLVRVTGLGIDEIGRLTESYKAAEAYCNGIIGEVYNNMLAELTERLDKNLADYHNGIMSFEKSELIDMADKIAEMSDAHRYMTSFHGYESEELRFYLRFQNPLEVVADYWLERNYDLSDMSFVMDGIYDKQDALMDYPLISDADMPKDASLRRYMDVDLYQYLGKIAEQVIIYYPNDWNIDKDVLWDKAGTPDLEQKRLIWHVCSTGTHIKPERDVFVRDSGAYEYMTDYHQNDPDMFGYVVEVTGREGSTVKGNIFEVGDYAEYAKYIRDTALPLASVTLTYSDNWGVNAGKTNTVSRNEYDNDRHRLMSESGNVTAVRFNPGDESELTELLRHERAKRMALPIGSTAELPQKVTDKLAEVRVKPEEVKASPDEKTPEASKKKVSIGERIQAGNKKARAQKPPDGSRPEHSKNTKKYDRS